ncbi:Hsp70 family protein [uncultured Selenomonas sp.]|uniref:Hsp70 family protein n=1 Tax=uncultured Selenomonas sp. TaxID=159275 RepID=UPI0025EE7163|nr:Hsp70 family protein [uncultured Selenomonas sp.]
MKYYVGIDLGTTNSAISTFDGERVRVWKSKKDQNDVTPSAIYIDKHNKRFYGKTAYQKAAQQPERCATLFKRFMGTSTKLHVADVDMTPEECSAEILRELYRNLPEEIRESDETATVITVPAEFNQMQKTATVDAAKAAGFSAVALMQEPVAAVMSVMKENAKDGTFLIYDLGGGTLDIAIAASRAGKVNLLANGGISVCGGRDFDRIVMHDIVEPWLAKEYQLPKDWKLSKKYLKLYRMATYLAEQAKLELSSEEEACIEGETGALDEAGDEIYLDIPLTRTQFDTCIAELVDKSIAAARETIEKTGLAPDAFDRIVFIGGPTNYKPLRDRVIAALGIEGSIEVNPMTAVSEGASMFAESIDWSTDDHERKSARGEMKSAKDLGLAFRYEARTTAPRARIAITLQQPAPGYTFEIVSADTGWSSGRADLVDHAMVRVPLSKRGENRFAVRVLDDRSRDVPLEEKDIVISYTLATVGAILASHSIGVEVRESAQGDAAKLDYLVREGDTLPAKGTRTYRATEEIAAGSMNSINFKLWEGELADAPEDNRFIGYMKIDGTDFQFGRIRTGAEIICNYTVNDSGSIELELEVPSIDEMFNGKNFYSRQEAQVDLDDAVERLHHDGKRLMERVKDMAKKLGTSNDNALQQAGETASAALTLAPESEREDVQQLAEAVLNAKKMLVKLRRTNLQKIRQREYDHLAQFCEEEIYAGAEASERERFTKLFTTARSVMDRNDSSFENVLETIRNLNYRVKIRQPEFVVQWFVWKIEDPADYSDRAQFEQLKALGERAIQAEDVDALREVCDRLSDIAIDRNATDMSMMANIMQA